MMLKELAWRYGVSTKTMSRWIRAHEDRIGKAIGRFYVAAQILIMHSIFGPFMRDGQTL